MSKKNNYPTKSELIEMATAKGEKLSPSDLKERWPECITDHGKHKGQGVVLSDGAVVRNDIECFYPNGIKPEPTGRKNNTPKGKSATEKFNALVANFNEFAASYGLEVDMAKTKVFQQLKEAIEAERNEKLKAIELAEAAEIAAYQERIALIRERNNRKKAAL